ncbi:MAG: DUF4405 domain-containing protein [Planctomycetaceae bacterium]
MSGESTVTEPTTPQKQECDPPQAGASGGFLLGLSKTIVNFWLDVLLLINFVFLVWTSAVLQYVFPAGIEAAGYSIWGLDVVGWENVQFNALAILTAGITLHVMLHWSWVCGVINRQILGRTVVKKDGTDTLIGVGLIAVLLHILAIGVLLAKWGLTKSS